MGRARLHRLDALRGLSVALMVIHHLLYDLVLLFGAPGWLFWNPLFAAGHYLFAGIFVALSGMCCRFSRSNGRRGARLLAVAMALTAVTRAAGFPIHFGILHLLSVCMLLYALVGRWTDRLPEAVHTGAFFLSLLWLKATSLRSPLLWVLGLPWPGMVSYDYFPLLPWMFLFFAGARLGGWAQRWQFAQLRPTARSRLGRQALPVYLLHQPVLFALLVPLRTLMG